MKKKLNVNEVLIRLVKLMVLRRPEEITFVFASRHCKIPRSTLIIISEAIEWIC